MRLVSIYLLDSADTQHGWRKRYSKHRRKILKLGFCSNQWLFIAMTDRPFIFQVLCTHCLFSGGWWVRFNTSSTITRTGQSRSPFVFRIGMCTQNKQTDLLLRNISAKWECCVPLGFQGNYHQAHQSFSDRKCQVCLALTFDVKSECPFSFNLFHHMLPYIIIIKYTIHLNWQITQTFPGTSYLYYFLISMFPVSLFPYVSNWLLVFGTQVTGVCVSYCRFF